MTTTEKQPLLSLNRRSTDDDSAKLHKFELHHSPEQEPYTPLFNTDGHINVIKKGILNMQQIYFGDPFHTIVNSPWRRVFVIISVVYLFIWILFGLGYFMCLELDDECIGNAHLIGGSHGPLERFFVGFFFSVQTQMTIGYGNTPPQNYFSNFLFVLQSLFSLLMEAVCIGIVYAKFGRPTTRVSSIKFSKRAIIGNRDGKRSFYFRFVDIRKHQLCEPHIRVYLATNEETMEGEKYINFQLLTTNYGENYLVFLGGYPCVIVHEITDESPLRNEDILKRSEILIIFEGVDATTASTIQARYSYQLKDIEFNVRFANIVTHKTEGLLVDFTLFDNTVPI